jgi:hypothetical protein
VSADGWTSPKLCRNPLKATPGSSIQKGQGTVALGKVLPQVVEAIRSRGGKLGEPKNYAEVIR